MGVFEATSTTTPWLFPTNTVKQAIGNFNSYSPIRIGDSFELDFDSLPVKRIELISAQTGKTHIVPLGAPLQIQEAFRWSGGKTCAIKIMEASTANPPHDCRILIVAQSLEKGSTVQVRIYVSGGGFIGSMAEAEGVLK